MRYFLLLYCLIAFIGTAVAQQQKDTVVRKYMVFRSKQYGYEFKFFKEGKKIFVKDTSGNKLTGLLKIMNDSTLVLVNAYKNKRDTFKLSEIEIVRAHTPGKTLIAGTFILGGFLMYGLAGLIKATGGLPEGVYQLMAMGMGADLLAIRLAVGVRLSHKKYKYKIVTTKGYKLKKRYVPYF